MKNNYIFQSKKKKGKYFEVLHISLMSGLIGDNWVLISALNSAWCDMLSVSNLWMEIQNRKWGNLKTAKKLSGNPRGAQTTRWEPLTHIIITQGWMDTYWPQWVWITILFCLFSNSAYSHYSPENRAVWENTVLLWLILFRILS